MAYTIDQIKVHAYNYTEKMDYTDAERDLFSGIAYCYEWYRAHPEDKKACEDRMNFYIDWYKMDIRRELNKGGEQSG